LTVRHNGKLVDAVAQSSKQGFVYVFDRVTGEPLWPIEERPVPKSEMPGEQAWPTQPFPTAPPPFARQKMTADDVNPYILTPEERAAWKDRIASARNEGLFTPPGLTESISLPGARGGNNWGDAASNPSKGMMYLTTQDWPTIYKLSLDDPLARRASGGNRKGPDQSGRAVYEQRCQACHGAGGAGSTMGPPRIAEIDSRMAFDAFRVVVLSGRAQMPAFPDLDDAALTALFAYLSNPGGGRAGRGGRGQAVTPPAGGPVVASGGAPGGLEIQAGNGVQYSPISGPPYPEGTNAPSVRYYTDWGLYPDQPYVIGPPWSSVVAYDLNSGTIKWKVPLGQDAEAAAEGASNTGAFQAEHHGIIVTSAGLLFVAASDGKVCALDTDTGRTLWEATLPTRSEGIPAMYEVNGRQYLVLSASSRINTGGGHAGRGGTSSAAAASAGDAAMPKGYVAFALPERRGR